MSDTTDFNPARTALVLVDPYRDMLADDGAVWPLLRDVAEQVGTRRNLLDLLAAVRSAGIGVVYAPHRRYRPGDVDGWTRLSRAQRRLRDGRLFAAGTPGGDWYPGLAPAQGDAVATEHWGLSGFAQTDLDLHLDRRGVRRILLAGLTAPGCVESTGRHAVELGYDVTLVADATAAFTPEHQHAAVHLNGPLYADEVCSTAELLERLAAR